MCITIDIADTNNEHNILWKRAHFKWGLQYELLFKNKSEVKERVWYTIIVGQGSFLEHLSRKRAEDDWH